MTFIYPSALWGLLLLLIPVLIHLFSFRRVVTVVFPSISFMEELKNETGNRTNLKHLLVLGSRLLFIFFTVMAFAQPIMTDHLVPDDGTLIYIDNSRSMSGEVVAGQIGLNKALELSDDFISRAPIDAKFQVLTNHSPVALSWLSKEGALDKLSDVRLSDVPKSFSQIMQKASALSQRMSFFYLSDFQKSTIGSIEASKEMDWQIKLIKIAGDNVSNIYVDTAYIEVAQIYDAQKRIRVLLKNSGNKDREAIQLKLISGQQLISTSSVDIKAGSESVVILSFDEGYIKEGQMKIELVDYPVYFDNIFHMSFPSAKINKIVHIHSKGYFTSAIEKVYGNKTYFEYTRVKEDEIDYGKLQVADFVILDGFESIPQSLDAYKDYNDFLIVPPKEIEKPSYQRFLSRSVHLVQDSIPIGLNIKDINDPFFVGVFNTKEADIGLLKAKRNIEVKGRVNVLVQNEFEKVYLGSVKNNDHYIYFFASPLTSEFTNVTNHATFLPLMYKMSMAGNRYIHPLYYDLSEDYVSIATRDFDSSKKLRVLNGATEWIPNYQYVAGRLLLELPPSGLKAGHYEILNGDSLIKRMALNESRVESEMEGYTHSELAKLDAKSQHIDLINVEKIENLTINEGFGDSAGDLFKIALILSLFFILSEALFIRFL
ncbi:MAG: BatA domain-containing protein [Cytophagales bacterium]